MKKKLSTLFLTYGLFIFSVDAATVLWSPSGTRINDSSLNTLVSVNTGSTSTQYTFYSNNYTACIRWSDSKTGNCTVYTIPQVYNFTITVDGALDYRPFSSISATGGSTCYLNVGVGYDDNGAYDWRSNGITSAMQPYDGSGLISSQTLKVINKHCSSITVADIGTISGSVSGYLFMGPTQSSTYGFMFGNPGPARGKILSVVLAARTSNLSWANSDFRVQSYIYGGTLITPETPPAPQIECNLNGVLEITHGVVDSNSLDGNKATADLQLMCNGEAKAVLKVLNPGGGELMVGEGIISNISILPNSTLDVSASGPVDFSIQSVLSKVGQVRPGNYSASTTLVIIYQ